MESKVFVNLVGQFSPNELSSKQNQRGQTASYELPTYAVRSISEFASSVWKQQNHSLTGGPRFLCRCCCDGGRLLVEISFHLRHFMYNLCTLS